MNKYIDLVLCKHPLHDKKYLFIAPPFSHLPNGSHVIVETKNGEQLAIVCQSITVEKPSSDFDFAIEATGAKLPLARVLKEIKYIDICYDDYNFTEGAENGVDKD